MKKLTIIMAVLLGLAIAIIARLNHLGMGDVDDINAMACANFSLANQLLFDGLQRETIDVYASHTNTLQIYQRSGHTIRIIPLRSADAEASFGNSNFIGHNNACVLMHVCHIWDEDRELALFLLTLLTQIDLSCNYLISELKPDGSLTSYGRKIVEGEQWQYTQNRNRYGTTVPRNIEQSPAGDRLKAPPEE